MTAKDDLNDERREEQPGLKHPEAKKGWQDNWQLKVIAFVLAIALWFYLFRQ